VLALVRLGIVRVMTFAQGRGNVATGQRRNFSLASSSKRR
jgi:hypothetical protein